MRVDGFRAVVDGIYTPKGLITHYRTWHGDGINIVVSFNQDDLVRYATAWGDDGTSLRCLREPETLFHRLLALLRFRAR
jgi:hypothetical protein